MVIMEFDDVMTLEEAAERWKKTSDALRQNCLGRVKNGFRKGTDSGKESIENQAESGWLHGQGWNEYMGKR